MKKGLFLNLLLCMFLLSGCSKEDEDNSTTTPLLLATEKELYAPLEIVTITASEAIFEVQTNSIEGTINGTVVNIQPGDTTASFLLPSLENGTYEVEFAIGEKNYKVPVAVQQLSNIASADSYYSQMTAGVHENIEQLNTHLQQLIAAGATPAEYAPIENDIEKYSNILQEYEDKYAALTSEEKKDFAAFMAANQNLIAEIEAANASFSSALSNMRTQQVQNYEAGVEVSAAAFVSSVITTVLHIPPIVILVTLITSPNPFSIGAALAGSVIVVSFLVHIAEVKTMVGILLNRALKPYENLTVSQTVYQMGQEIEVGITAKYRSLIGTDGLNSDNGSVIIKIISSFDTFKEKINNLNDKLPQKFKSANPIQAIKSTFNSAVRPVFNQYISISNISNPNVTLEKINQEDGSIKVKATNSASTDQQFTYDIEYTNQNFTKALKKTVNAEVKAAADSLAMYQAAALGSWKVQLVESGPAYDLTLQPNGEGYYYVEGGAGSNNGYYYITWDIYKTNGKYFLRQNGFWHPAFVDYRVFDPSLPNSYLTYPITSFTVYNDLGSGSHPAIIYTKN